MKYVSPDNNLRRNKMQVQNVSPSFTGKNTIVISRAKNANKTYLYNDVVDMVNKHKVPATFKTDGIDIEPQSGTQKAGKIEEALKKLGIIFTKGE